MLEWTGPDGKGNAIRPSLEREHAVCAGEVAGSGGQTDGGNPGCPGSRAVFGGVAQLGVLALGCCKKGVRWGDLGPGIEQGLTSFVNPALRCILPDDDG